jgi:hypothetical protein
MKIILTEEQLRLITESENDKGKLVKKYNIVREELFSLREMMKNKLDSITSNADKRRVKDQIRSLEEILDRWFDLGNVDNETQLLISCRIADKYE